MSGIGFLGAGTILLRGEIIRGLTTAASYLSHSICRACRGSGLHDDIGLRVAHRPEKRRLLTFTAIGFKRRLMIERLSEALSPWSDVWVRSGWRVQIHCATSQSRTLDARGDNVASGSPEHCIGIAARSAPKQYAERAVVLLHGIWDSPRLMVPLADALQAKGWAIANVAYPSTRLPVAEHGISISRVARALAEGGAREVSFVGFSLGGLVARSAMANAKKDDWNPGRLILIGSPARGSVIAKRFQNFPGYRAIVGGCSQDITPVGAARIPKPHCRGLMVIAGGTGSHGYNPLIPGDDDRLIAVEETRIRDHETEFVLVNSIHRLLPVRPETISTCCNFLGSP